jgi:hypothetical protein
MFWRNMLAPYSGRGFGGLAFSMLASGTRVRGFKHGRSCRVFSSEKNPQRAFLRKGSKAICPMSQICGMLKNPVITWKLGHSKICQPFLTRFLPSLTEVSDAWQRGAPLELAEGTKRGAQRACSLRPRCIRVTRTTNQSTSTSTFMSLNNEQ